MLKHVVRNRLLHRLSTPVSLITAPAGYGKTTLAHQWAATTSHPVASVGFENAKTNRHAFLSQFHDVLRGLQSGGRCEQPDSLTLDALIVSMDSISSASGGLTVILDECDRLASDAEQALGQLIQRRPSSVRMMIISRRTLDLTLGKLHALGHLSHLTAVDLAFTLSELEEAIEGSGLHIFHCRQLLERTEGWATGLQIAIRTLNGDQNSLPDASLRDFLSDFAHDHWLVTYIRDEVLAELSDELRAFVLETAALPELSADLCNAARDSTDSASLIRELARQCGFITPVQPLSTTMRCHPLIADVLVHLSLTDPGSSTLHAPWKRAAQWLAEEHRFGEALELAIRAQDWNQATTCALLFVRDPASQDRVDLTRHYLGLLPKNVMLSNDELAFAYIQACNYAGTFKDAKWVVDAILPLWEASNSSTIQGYAASIHGHINVLDGNADEALGALYRAIDLTPQDQTLYRLQHWTAISHLEFIRNDTRASEHAYREAARCRASLTHSPYMWDMFLRPDRANQLAMRGDLHRAEEMYRDQYQLSTEAHDRPMSKPLAILAAVYHEWGRFDLALEALARMEDDQDAFPYDVWRPEGLNLAAMIFLDCGMHHEASRALEDSIALLQERGGTMHLRRARAIQARMWLREGKVDRAREWAMIEQQQPALPARAFRDLDPRFPLIEVLLSDGNWAEAAEITQLAIDSSPTPNRTSPRLRFLVWNAVAHAYGGNIDQADNALREALMLGTPGGFTHTFHPYGFDLNPNLKRLRPDVPPEAQEHVEHLLHQGTIHSPLGRHISAAPTATTVSNNVRLTKRELEVLRLVHKGQINRQIADELFITERTVKKHLLNAYRKLNVPNRTAAAARAQELGLLSSPRRA